MPSRADRSRTLALALAAAVCVVSVIVLIVISARHGARSHQAQTGALATTTLPRATTTVGPTTTTSAPAPLVMISDDSRQASYRLQGPAVEVKVMSSASCWVEITGAATGGPVTYAGVLRPGVVETVTSGPASGASLLVADPALISLNVNGAPMALPQLSGGQPYTLHFQPAVA